MEHDLRGKRVTLIGLGTRAGGLGVARYLVSQGAEVTVTDMRPAEALAEPLSAPDARGHGSGVVPADEALAHVALEASGRPLVVSNADLSSARVAGLTTDVVSSFLHGLADGAGLTLHVRLIEGHDTHHVLDAIFKSLGVALAQACSLRRGAR